MYYLIVFFSFNATATSEIYTLSLHDALPILLGHTPPTDYADFLQQRLEINYFAACCLMPETASVAFLQQAKKDRNLARSEEHTSELQSRPHLVCRLLLEKKKKQKPTSTHTYI